MMQWWPALLGWPAILVGLTLSVCGLFEKKPFLLYLAAGLILPVSLYLAATPRLSYFGLLVPVALLLAGICIKRFRIKLAFAFVLSVNLFFVWLAMVIVW